MTDPDEFARQYMTAEPQPNIQIPVVAQVPVPVPVSIPIHVPAPIPVHVPVSVPAPIPAPIPVNVPVPAPVPVSVATPVATPVATSVPTQSIMSDQTLKDILYSPVFRVAVVFLLVFVMLIVIKPSFVEHRTKDQNPLESAPISYKRLMIFTGLVILLVVVVPIIWEHQLKIAEVFDRVRRLASSNTS